MQKQKKIRIVSAPTTALEYITQQIAWKETHIKNERRRLEMLYAVKQDIERK